MKNRNDRKFGVRLGREGNGREGQGREGRGREE
jgi:hypothetical protein